MFNFENDFNLANHWYFSTPDQSLSNDKLQTKFAQAAQYLYVIGPSYNHGYDTSHSTTPDEPVGHLNQGASPSHLYI